MRVPPYRARVSGRRLAGGGQQRWEEEEEEEQRGIQELQRQVAWVEGWELDHPGHQFDRRPPGCQHRRLVQKQRPPLRKALKDGGSQFMTYSYHLRANECRFAAVKQLERAWRASAPGRRVERALEALAQVSAGSLNGFLGILGDLCGRKDLR